MALLVLIVLGAAMGWLSSIITRSERARDILRLMGVGAVGCVLVGLIANSGTFLGGLSFIAFGAAVAGGATALVIYHAVMKSRAEV